MVAVAVTRDPVRARALAAAEEAGYAALPAYRRVLDLEGADTAADLLLAGSVDRVVDGLGTYVEAGATDLRIVIGSSDESVRRDTRDALGGLLAG